MAQVKVEKLQDIVVLAPKGQLVGGDETTAELERQIRELANAGNMKLLLNLKDVDFINSWALGVIIGAHANYSKRGGQIKLCSLSPRNSQLMTITKLVRIFDIYEARDEALKSFR
jgi:anti-sigma B factor antagonist